MPQQVPLMFFNATRDSGTGTIFLKVANRAATTQQVSVAISGLATIDPRGKATTLAAKGPNETNSVSDPKRIVPVVSNVDGLGANFSHTFPPYSVTVLELGVR